MWLSSNTQSGGALFRAESIESGRRQIRRLSTKVYMYSIVDKREHWKGGIHEIAVQQFMFLFNIKPSVSTECNNSISVELSGVNFGNKIEGF